MKKIFLFLSLALLGNISCTANQSIPFYMYEKSEKDMELLKEAAAWFGYDANFYFHNTDKNYGYGTVHISLVNKGRNGLSGLSSKSLGCRRIAWSEPNVTVIAHELGHTLGLDHVSDTENLMHKSGKTRTGTDIKGWQYEQVQKSLNLLCACTPKRECN